MTTGWRSCCCCFCHYFYFYLTFVEATSIPHRFWTIDKRCGMLMLEDEIFGDARSHSYTNRVLERLFKRDSEMTALWFNLHLHSSLRSGTISIWDMGSFLKV
ncbi:hypothetical protein HHI36_021791, partial [Cryptolaemus montrouzieri]